MIPALYVIWSWGKERKSIRKAKLQGPRPMEDAEAHYNLGMSFYRLKAMQEEDPHFIKASE